LAVKASGRNFSPFLPGYRRIPYVMNMGDFLLEALQEWRACVDSVRRVGCIHFSTG